MYASTHALLFFFRLHALSVFRKLPKDRDIGTFNFGDFEWWLVKKTLVIFNMKYQQFNTMMKKSRSISENHSLGHQTIPSSPSIEVKLGSPTTRLQMNRPIQSYLSCIYPIPISQTHCNTKSFNCLSSPYRFLIHFSLFRDLILQFIPPCSLAHNNTGMLSFIFPLNLID